MDSGAGFPLGTGSSPDHAAMRVHSGQRLLAYQPKEGVWVLFGNWKPATLGSRAADTNPRLRLGEAVVQKDHGLQPTLQESVAFNSGCYRKVQTHGILLEDNYFKTEQLKVLFTVDVCPSKDSMGY